MGNGSGMSVEFKKLFESRKILRIQPDEKLVAKELEAAEADLATARISCERKDFKWATIQGYYSIFHSARSLAFSKGYREKTHYALLVILREVLYDELGNSFIRLFEDSMHIREDADYDMKFSEKSALDIIEGAEDFLEKANGILRKQ